MDWCEGFIEAVYLRRESWDRFLESKEANEWMFPILAHLFDEDGRSLVGVSEDELDDLFDASAEKIPETVPKIFEYWKGIGRDEKNI